MKIGIITFHWALNYGAVLQAYALQTYLESMGHKVEVIDYRPKWANDNKHRRIPRHIVESVETVDFYCRKHNFRKFCSNYLHLSERRYCYGDIISDYDAVITGSDQVFNPDIIAPDGQLDEMYLLGYVAKGVKKLSYAASFGNSTLLPVYNERYKELLSEVDALSVREQSGANILKGLGIHAETVPDPTILLGDFSDIINDGSVKSDDYILSFIFQPSEKVSQIQNQLQKTIGKPLYSIQSMLNMIKGKKGFYNPTPSEWIEKIQASSLVITDSFHSSVFSILLHRPFISLSLDAWGGDWSERIKALLNTTGLSERMPNAPSESTMRFLCFNPIQWAKVESRLSELRLKGHQFLASNL